MSRPRWTGPAAAALGTLSGVYLMIAPVWFGYLGTPAETSHRVVGPVLAVLWIVSAWDVTRSVRWWTAPLAAWLLIEPLVLDESAAAAVGAVAVGLVCIALAVAAHHGDVKAKYAGGWIGLWRPLGGARRG